MAYRDRLKTHHFTIPMTKKDMDAFQVLADARDTRKTEMAREVLITWLRAQQAEAAAQKVA
jgi:hypothetical protein